MQQATTQQKGKINPVRLGELLDLTFPCVVQSKIQWLDEEQTFDALKCCYEKVVRDQGHVPQLDEATIEHIHSAARWLTAPYSFPGLCLYGSIGSGKTTLGKAIAMLLLITYREGVDREKKHIRIVNSFDIVEDVRNNKIERIASIRQEEWLMIDDVGYEDPLIYVFNNSRHPVGEILNWRCGKRDLKTIITTNLLEEEFTERYGIRLGDRSLDTFALVGYNNPSYRGKFFAHA